MIVRTLTGIVAAFALAAAAVVATAPAVPTQFAPREMDVLPAEQNLGCPGSLRLPVGADDDPDNAFGSGSDDVRYSHYSQDDEPAAVGVGWSFAAQLATSVERVGDGDLAGLAAVACLEPATDAWLLGGSTKLGNSARLVLVNPTTAASEVTVTIHGAAGPVSPQAIVAVGAGATQEVLLEAVASEVEAMALHVEATGAGVVAVLQDSRLDGFVPAGTDWVAPSPAAATSLVIPGVGPSNEGDGFAWVRLLSPAGADVTLTFVDDLGQVAWQGVAGITLEEGTVLDVQVPASAAGSVLVDATAPVFASAVSLRSRVPDEALEGTLARDIAWVQGRPYDAGRELKAVVPQYQLAVAVYAHADTEVSVWDAATGDLLAAQQVARGTSARISFEAPVGTEIEVTGAVSWVVLVSDAPGFRTAVEPTDVTGDPVTVSVLPAPYSETDTT